MPVRGAAIRAEQLRDRRPHRPPEVHVGRGRLAARRAARLERAARLRLVRSEPDPRRRARLGEGPQGAGRPARRDVALRRARRARSGSRPARTTTSRASCRCCARTSTCASATSSASTVVDEPYDIAPRRLRARDEDRRGPPHLRLPEGASGAARQGGRRANTPETPASAPSRLDAAERRSS